MDCTTPELSSWGEELFKRPQLVKHAGEQLIWLSLFTLLIWGGGIQIIWLEVTD